ncbi:MAG: hypothetical protein E6370_16540 [Clostridiales bacterium]|jgi:hypothetical protein|nr:hypothetical protein [Clostridiales bacterium]
MIKENINTFSAEIEYANGSAKFQINEDVQPKQHYAKEMSAEEKEFLRYQSLMENFKREYQTEYFYKYDEDDVLMDVVPHTTQTEDSKREEAVLYNVTRNKELVKDLANLLGQWEIEQVSAVRYLLNSIMNFIETDISKVELMLIIVNAIKVATPKTDVLEKLKDKKNFSEGFIREFTYLIKKYGDTTSDF